MLLTFIFIKHPKRVNCKLFPINTYLRISKWISSINIYKVTLVLMSLKNTRYFFTPSLFNENIQVCVKSDVLHDIHLIAFGNNSQLYIRHNFFSNNHFNPFYFHTNDWNLSLNSNNPKGFPNLTEVEISLIEHCNIFLQKINSVERQHHHSFCHILLILTIFNFYILMHLKNYMRYFYHYGGISNRLLTIFLICIQLFFLFHNLVSFEQQKGKSITGTLDNTSKFINYNTDFLAKTIIIISSCLFSSIACNKRTISSARQRTIIWGIVFIAFHHNETNENIKTKLKYCTTCTFFSQESILFGNLICKLHLHDELFFLT